MASMHGGVRPWWLQGSSVTYRWPLGPPGPRPAAHRPPRGPRRPVMPTLAQRPRRRARPPRPPGGWVPPCSARARRGRGRDPLRNLEPNFPFSHPDSYRRRRTTVPMGPSPAQPQAHPGVRGLPVRNAPSGLTAGAGIPPAPESVVTRTNTIRTRREQGTWARRPYGGVPARSGFASACQPGASRLSAGFGPTVLAFGTLPPVAHSQPPRACCPRLTRDSRTPGDCEAVRRAYRRRVEARTERQKLTAESADRRSAASYPALAALAASMILRISMAGSPL